MKRSLACHLAMPHADGMRISDAAFDEFIELYKEEFGREIGRAEATAMAHRLLVLSRLMAQLSVPKTQVMPPS